MPGLPVSEARAALGDILDRVRLRGERVRLSKNGKDVAAVVPIEDLELLRQLEDRLDLDDARRALAEAERKGTVPWKKIKQDLGL